MNELIITCGDPAGIGPEIVLNALSQLSAPDTATTLVMPENVFDQARELTGVQLNARRIKSENISNKPHPGEIRLWFPEGSIGNFPRGEISREAGEIARIALETGVTLARQAGNHALVTAPVNKQSLNLAGFEFPGQTEFLADRDHAARVQMIMVHPRMTTLLATIHIPLLEVSRRLTRELLLNAIRDYHQFLTHYRPGEKIIVLALNPHASDGGMFGHEEADIIVPAVEDARNEGIAVTGPISADTAFQKPGGHFLAMYHDQGMIPFKTASGWEGVNLTWGLGFIRTSPDHGTAFDLAGKGIASASSMVAAIELAQELSV